MKRVFTFGCSYTFYSSYPTWADFLGLEFDNFENWGQTGIGCRAISERIAECHMRNKFTSEDVIIVQWTGHLRHDYYKPLPHPSNGRNNNLGWKTLGNIFNEWNGEIFDHTWENKFFWEPAYVMHSMNAMILVQNFLESIGCEWYMTSIGEWPKLGTDVDFDKTSPYMPETAVIQEEMPWLAPYVDAIWHGQFKDRWLEPMFNHAQQRKDLAWYFVDHNGKEYLEPHSSPAQHVEWLNDVLRPKLGLGPAPLEQKLWLEELERLKAHCKNSIKELHDVQRKRFNLGWAPPGRMWPTDIKGF